MPILSILLFALPTDPAALCALSTFPDDLSPADLDRSQLSAVIADEPECMPAHYLLGYAYLDDKHRDLAAAMEHLERARELAPENAATLTLLGQVYLTRAGEESSLSDARRGVDLLEQAIAADPDHLDARAALASFHRQAPWIAGGDIDEAYEQAAEIRKRDPARGILEQVRTLYADDEEAEALALARTTLESFPDYAPLVVEYAVLMHRQENFAEAHRVLLAASQAEDADANVLYQLGRTAALSGKFIEDGRYALQRYLVRAEAGEDVPIPAAAAWWRLGLIEQHDGRLDAARTAFEKSLELDPEYEEAAKALKALSR